jgi:hypothetical protein
MRRGSHQAFGLFFALLALMAQLTLATAVPATTVSLADVTVLCQHDTSPDAPAKPPHQAPDCLDCFFCFNSGALAGLVATPPPLPAPASVFVARAAVPPSVRAPPFRIVLSARPRGPPASA